MFCPARTILVQMVSAAGTGYFFNTKRNRLRDKLVLRKHDPFGKLWMTSSARTNSVLQMIDTHESSLLYIAQLSCSRERSFLALGSVSVLSDTEFFLCMHIESCRRVQSSAFFFFWILGVRMSSMQLGSLFYHCIEELCLRSFTEHSGREGQDNLTEWITGFRLYGSFIALFLKHCIFIYWLRVVV